jgi:hypothetical protein
VKEKESRVECDLKEIFDDLRRIFICGNYWVNIFMMFGIEKV